LWSILATCYCEAKIGVTFGGTTPIDLDFSVHEYLLFILAVVLTRQIVVFLIIRLLVCIKNVFTRYFMALSPLFIRIYKSAPWWMKDEKVIKWVDRLKSAYEAYMKYRPRPPYKPRVRLIYVPTPVPTYKLPCPQDVLYTKYPGTCDGSLFILVILGVAVYWIVGISTNTW